MGRTPKSRQLTDEEQAAVRTQFTQGTPLRVLAREYGVSAYFIKKAVLLDGSKRGGYAGAQQE